ncbi:caprin-1-like isoform X2 [Ostrea edulis]|uniref:caprin-1-like isoform X2 n=1 Tax=Ostrea edulis TaxID=37623 RepID=UPI002094435D|nr:caprin-1-like isoform X2 [Ostrea edulis]
MPAASTKQETKTSPEAVDPMKQVLIVMDKKVRNLEKRKGKLDGYKEKKDSGMTLEKDQQLAIDRYGEVVQNLEFARELQKQFTTLAQEAERSIKKQAKKEKVERQNVEVKRTGDILRYQNLLDAMGAEKVRSDFQTGKHGAVVLTEENLTQLDELYKLLSPSREGETNYTEGLAKASDHFVNLLDGKDKPVVGTTYKDLKVLIDLIDDCGYFEHAMEEEEGQDSEFVVVNTTEIPKPDSAEVQASLPPEQTEAIEQSNTATPSNTDAQLESMREADSFFSQKSAAPPQENPPLQQQQQSNVPYPRQRPFQEIVSEVQGSCIFLQESTIDMESPHMDPAVVAVTSHPMGHPTATQQSDPAQISSQTYTNQGFPQASQQKSVLSQQTVDYSQTFSQTLPSDSLFQSTDSNSSPMSQNVLNQNVSDSTISQFEMPPQIPMPPGQEERSQDVQAQKFQMNPNAEMFQSKMHSAFPVSDEGQNPDEFAQHQQDDQQGDYGNGFNSGYRSRGGFRGGRGGRGGDRGGMSNGYGGRGRGNYGGNRGNYQGYNNRDNYRGENYNSYNNGYQKRGQSRGGPRGAGRGGPRGGFNNKGGSGGGFRSGNNSGGFGKPPSQQQAA